MLEVPVQRMGTDKSQTEQPPPCYRCLFEKPFPEGWCSPETCEMLDAWLTDVNFSWEKYETGWAIRLEMETLKKYEPSQNE